MTIRRLSVLAACSVALSVGLPPAHVGAQASLRFPPPGERIGSAPSATLVARADSAYFAGRPAEALDLLEDSLAADPNAYDARWRAARAAVALGILAQDEAGEQAWLERGAAHGRAAVAQRPDGMDGVFWLTAAQGWLALVVGNPGRVASLADSVWSRGHWLLARDPDHAGAHHALGKANFEVMTLSRVERLLGRLFVGGAALAQASWAGAFEHLERAVEQAPEVVLYHIDLAEAYARSDRPARARRELEEALRLPSVHPPDELFKRRAERMLLRLP